MAGFNPGSLLSELEAELESLMESEELTVETVKDLQTEELELKKIETPTAEQNLSIEENQNSLKKARLRLQKIRNQIKHIERQILSLKEPLADKLTDDIEEFSRCLGTLLHRLITSFLPNVIFWTYSDDYILQGETNFDIIQSATSLNDIPRPLVNLFRIGCKINSIEDLKTLVQEIQEDGGERSRYTDQLNKEIDKYLNSVWKDYDQKIKISLEQERILVQFYDPQCKSASYYNMQERSQGCQTFLSFLLTIGVEAKRGVIKDTVLLLDEPETRLHPSGVRFMLKELIKAGQNGNTVLFATHSIFMIDNENFDRHIIVKKKHERTDFLPSKKDRIGYFMQEEVLYGALEFNPTGGLTTRNQFNIVFEGKGDVLLFDCFYNQVLKKNDRPTAQKNTSIYHGGKCTDIIKYLKRKPILLGTTWVFILDNDKPAMDLKEHLENHYGKYINECIFIFQYEKRKFTEGEGALESCEGDVELEDLLSEDLLREAIIAAAADHACEIDESKITSSRLFGEYFSEIVESVDNSSGFKANVKQHLNSRIENKIKDIKNLEQMQEFAPDYTEWATNVVRQLKEGRDQSEATESTD